MTNEAKPSASRRPWAWLLGLSAAVAAAALAIAPTTSAHPPKLGSLCTGTYLIQESGGAQTLWTFHKDGTLVASSSGELLWNFGSQHGAWKPAGWLRTRAAELSFKWTADGLLESINRVDIEMRGQDPACRTVSGEFIGRAYPPESDPLVTDGVEPLFGDTFTGRRLRP